MIFELIEGREMEDPQMSNRRKRIEEHRRNVKGNAAAILMAAYYEDHKAMRRLTSRRRIVRKTWRTTASLTNGVIRCSTSGRRR